MHTQTFLHLFYHGTDKKNVFHRRRLERVVVVMENSSWKTLKIEFIDWRQQLSVGAQPIPVPTTCISKSWKACRSNFHMFFLTMTAFFFTVNLQLTFSLITKPKQLKIHSGHMTTVLCSRPSSEVLILISTLIKS